MDLQHSPNWILLSFRITSNHWNPSDSIYTGGSFCPADQNYSKIANGQDLLEYYIINIKNYLKAKGISILASIGGLHLNAKRPHIHYHLIVEGKQPKSHIQTWKYYFNHNPVIVPHKLSYPSLVEGHQDQKLDISIKHTELKTQDDMESFLAYPLKEGKNLIDCMHNLDSSYHYLETLATTIYKKSLAVRAAQERSQKKQLGIYSRVTEYMDEQMKLQYSYYQIALNVLEKFKTLEKRDQIHPSKLVKIIQTYAYYSGLLTNEEILEKYNL
ncbi:MAG: hypothetical protein [Circular genetic element sp.]|nr:MAG: hypothetical protein [Circular genetic element sp.]